MDNLTLMCFKAIEIQKLCQYKIGDRVYYWDGGHFSNKFILDEIAIYEHEDLHKEVLGNTKLWIASKEWDELTGIYIWKPYQGQLQEMLFPKDWIPRECMIIMRKFQYFYEQNCDGFTSFEELWLAFVMYEKYSKIWNGGEWEAIK